MRRAAIFALGLVGCASPISLTVDLRTDLVPGVEFTAVRTTVATSYVPGTAPSGRAVDHAVFFGDRYADGVRIAELDGVATGQSFVVVELLDAHGTTIALRPVAITVTASYALTVVVTRDCRAVHCPGAVDATTAVACLGGRCVEPTCGAGGSCGTPTCTTAADCTAGSACTVASCVMGACFYAGGSCPTGDYCDPSGGCLPDPTVDAGTIDAGPPEAGEQDGGPLACNAPRLLGPADHVGAASDATGALVAWSAGATVSEQRVEGGGVTAGSDTIVETAACSLLHVAQRSSGFLVGCMTAGSTLFVSPVDAAGHATVPTATNDLTQAGGFAFLVDAHAVTDHPDIAWLKGSGANTSELHQGTVGTDGTVTAVGGLVASGLDAWRESLVGAEYASRAIVAFAGRGSAYSAEWLAFGGGVGQHMESVGTIPHATGGPLVGLASTSTLPSELRWGLVEADVASIGVVGIDEVGATNGGGGPFTSSSPAVAAMVGVPYAPSGGFRYAWSATDGVHHGTASVDVGGVSIPVTAFDDGAFAGHTGLTDIAIAAIGFAQYVVIWVESGNAWIVLGCD